MKVGILTYHRAINYGAVWQCYALKKSIEDLGHIVEIIDYWPSYHAKHSKLIPPLHLREHLTSVAGLIKYLYAWYNLIMGFKRILDKRKGFYSFFQNRLNLEKNIKYKTHNNLTALNFDVVIYGSDQVWRYWRTHSFIGFDKVYFGDFINAKRKVSYAASMGIIEGVDENKSELKRLWNSLDAISVRELTLQQLVNQHTSQVSHLVIDPVFLLSKKRWMEIIPKTKRSQKKYILFYHLMKSEEAKTLVNKLSKSLDLPVFEVHGAIQAKYNTNRYQYVSSSPEKMLSLILDAEVVVSTSFHGAAISIQFEKDFYVLGMQHKADRAKTLLNQLGISERYIDDVNKFEKFETIDWTDVRVRKNSYTKHSIEFLKQQFAD